MMFNAGHLRCEDNCDRIFCHEHVVVEAGSAQGATNLLSENKTFKANPQSGNGKSPKNIFLAFVAPSRFGLLKIALMQNDMQ